MNCKDYCLPSHTALAGRRGGRTSRSRLPEAQGGPLFSEAEKVAIHLAEMMTVDSHAYTDVVFARLRSFYSEGEVVELMTALGLFNYFNRFNDLLQMEPTQPASTEVLAQLEALTIA